MLHTFIFPIVFSVKNAKKKGAYSGCRGGIEATFGQADCDF